MIDLPSGTHCQANPWPMMSAIEQASSSFTSQVSGLSSSAVKAKVSPVLGFCSSGLFASVGAHKLRLKGHYSWGRESKILPAVLLDSKNEPIAASSPAEKFVEGFERGRLALPARLPDRWRPERIPGKPRQMPEKSMCGTCLNLDKVLWFCTSAPYGARVKLHWS